jgi:hypothetical protein
MHNRNLELQKQLVPGDIAPRIVLLHQCIRINV